MTRLFTLFALTGMFLMANAESARAQEDSINMTSTTWFVQVLMVDISYPDERFYWSTELMTTSQPEAEFFYELLVFAMEEGELHNLMFGSEPTRMTPADVRLTWETTTNFEFNGTSTIESLIDARETEELIQLFNGREDTATKPYERVRPSYQTPTYNSKTENK